MKYSLFYLLILVSLHASGQVKDRRARLAVSGNISVAPDGKIWVTSTKGAGYTSGIDVSWHYSMTFADSIIMPTILERIFFFNRDTAMITGFIEVSGSEPTKHGGYATKDGGRSWQIFEFGGDDWIYDAFVDKAGRAWMGGSSGHIYYSQDFGQHWRPLHSPHDSSGRIYRIFMRNGRSGIAAGLGNFLNITSDNWTTSRKIPTPFDQKRYKEKNDNTDPRIEKLALWKSFIVVSQGKHIFYTDTGHIDWKIFPDVVTFALDKESNEFFAVTANNEVVVFSDLHRHHPLCAERLTAPPSEILAVNHAVYLYNQRFEICKVTTGGIAHAFPYTTDEPIPTPGMIQQGQKLTWGVEGSHLYLAEDGGADWYRENILWFFPWQMKLLNDSTAIFWDGTENYCYSLRDHMAKIYRQQNPLKDFLSAPVASLTIVSGISGCFTSKRSIVAFKNAGDTALIATGVQLVDFKSPGTTMFTKTIASEAVKNVLATIDKNPLEMPSLADYKINDADKRKYLDKVKEQLHKTTTYDDMQRSKYIDSAFYFAVPAMLDTLGDSTMAKVLRRGMRDFSTSSNHFHIGLVSENGDSLAVFKTYFSNSGLWGLPWIVRYKGVDFMSYNLAFSQFISTCVPADFFQRDRIFDNSLVIMEIADYLWEEERKKR